MLKKDATPVLEKEVKDNVPYIRERSAKVYTSGEGIDEVFGCAGKEIRKDNKHYPNDENYENVRDTGDDS